MSESEIDRGERREGGADRASYLTKILCGSIPSVHVPVLVTLYLIKIVRLSLGNTYHQKRKCVHYTIPVGQNLKGEIHSYVQSSPTVLMLRVCAKGDRCS